MKPFSIQKIKKDIYLIKEDFYQEHANIYLFGHEDKCLLFDCGLGFFDLKKDLLGLGYKSFITAITHSHFDHIGGINHFENNEILITDQQLNYLHKKQYLGLNYLELEDFNDLDRSIAVDFCNNFKIKNRILSNHNKNVIKFFGYEFQIIKTPGHTSDSLCFYEKNKKILLTGDTLYDGEPFYNFSNSSIDLFRESLTNLSNLDVDLVLPGHNQVLTESEMESVIKEWKLLLN